MTIRRVFSGIQPTGIPHIGNYLGAIKNWVKLQNESTNQLVMFCIVDLHSMTTHSDPLTRKENIYQMLASLLACGIDPQKSLLFQQSRVPYHGELSWMLSCLTSNSQLNRMHQWKTKSTKERDHSNVGLFSYPVLMAADILLYKATHVPVGDDQVQHINLMRDITTTFNNKYGRTFTTPQSMMTEASRIMNLRKPHEKMSKSEKEPNSRVDLTDSDDAIQKKLRKALTDSEPYIHSLSDRPGVRNLVTIYSAFGDISQEDIVDRYKDVQYFTAPLKNDLVDIVINHIRPIRERYYEIMNDRCYLESVLAEGSEKAVDIAKDTMEEVYLKVGMR